MIQHTAAHCGYCGYCVIYFPLTGVQDRPHLISQYTATSTEWQGPRFMMSSFQRRSNALTGGSNGPVGNAQQAVRQSLGLTSVVGDVQDGHVHLFLYSLQ